MISKIHNAGNSRITKVAWYTDSLYSTTEVASLVGLQPASVRRLAIKHNIGRKLSDRVRVFSEHDIERLRQRKTTPGKARKETR
jgi:hypothetical protein